MSTIQATSRIDCTMMKGQLPIMAATKSATWAPKDKSDGRGGLRVRRSPRNL
ncbi:hypothetical protein GCM10007874_42190 [Labrys miyagiensis]|uniref:Uncharacterized protein n=1 Tax=Labrys miyagiensis TaxID=346912 RepID=A0ABQ6CNL7_9HYPH|nr:hypothetical protein GCM10007874_42190 [Labrys miyagiensis]